MRYKVTISERAQANLLQILEYLGQNWSEKVKKSFLQRLIRVVGLISHNPYLFPASFQKNSIHKCVVTKHNVLYYRITDHEVEIITIHDTRQAPNKLEL